MTNMFKVRSNVTQGEVKNVKLVEALDALT